MVTISYPPPPPPTEPLHLPTSPPPISSGDTTRVTRIPPSNFDLESGTSTDEEDSTRTWLYFFGGLGLAFFVEFLALIPLRVLPELRKNKKAEELICGAFFRWQFFAIIRIIAWFVFVLSNTAQISSSFPTGPKFPSVSDISNTFPSPV